MDGVEPGDAVTKEEIFGPLMALISYSDLDQLVETLKTATLTPDALYLYRRCEKSQKAGQGDSLWWSHDQ